MADHILQLRFSTGDVMRGADVSNANMQSWIKRNIITGQRFDGGGSPGKFRSFSWFAMMEIACAAALIETGISSPQDAFQAATYFAHMSDGGSGWEGDPRGPERIPGLPYDLDQGETFLFVSGERSQVLRCETGKINLYEVMTHLRNPCGFVALDVTRLFLTVTARLNLDGRDMLAAAYAKVLA